MDDRDSELIRQLLANPRFPRAARYPAQQLLAANMGPNPLWLAEWLAETIEPKAGMRILDLGCGKALTSVFFAREFGARVYAADLWVSADENWRRIVEMGEADRVTPMHVEAHALPFAEGFFDAIVSVDSYQYYGTDVLYLHYLSRFLRPGGKLGIVVPGLMRDFPDGKVPEHLLLPQKHGSPFWEDECVTFKTANWWRALAGECSRVRVLGVDTLPDGWWLWRDFERAAELSGTSLFPSCVEALENDAGRYIGFVRLWAERTASTGYNLYDAELHAKVEASSRKSEDGSGSEVSAPSS